MAGIFWLPKTEIRNRDLGKCVYLSANRFSMAWENGIQNSISIFRFSFSHDIEKQIWISFFVFTSLWKTHLSFVFRFCFRILDFEKGIWISFFVFTSLWKTDLNFVFVWLVIWKTDLNFVCHLKSPDTPSGLTGEFTFYAKESNWIWPRGQSEWWTPPPPWYVPHTRYSLFNKGWQIIWW